MLQQICEIARKAGQAIMGIYQNQDLMSVTLKTDQTPVTAADIAAHHIIVTELNQLTPTLPLLSEEDIVAWEKRRDWSDYWLIDPLDGTKEFLQRNDEFTVNIAFIQQGKPILAVVYAPALEVMYFADQQQAWKEDNNGVRKIAVVKHFPPHIVTSRSHQDQDLTNYCQKVGKHIRLHVGSSLKFCMVAEGIAQFYPRFGATHIWDTAAGQAIAVAAGAAVQDWAGNTLNYWPRSSLLNPGFLVSIPT